HIAQPSRSASKGPVARLGSMSRVETARTAQKAASARGVTHASLPPATMAVASPRLMISKASPIACAPEAQGETVQLLGPRAPIEVEISQATMSAYIICNVTGR